MRSRCAPHVLVAFACIRGVAADPTPTPDIPDWQAGPAKIAVTGFENHVPNGKSLEWVVAEAPFEIAEKAENILDLDAVNPPLFVPGERVPADPDTVAAYGKKMGVELV